MDGFKDFFSKLLNVSLFGWLESIPFWRNLPYQWKGGILRALKAALSYGVGVALTIPLIGLNPVIAVIIAAILQGADKAIREWKVDQEAGQINQGIPTSGEITPDSTVNTDATVIETDPTSGEETVNTDATVVEPVNTDATTDSSMADPTVFDDPVEDDTT